MPLPYCYDHPRPAVTVDLAAFSRKGDSVRVLLIRRKHDPFAGRWALPGGFLDMDERIEDAARREFKEETGLDTDGPPTFLGVFGDPGRDPRGRTISIAYFAVLHCPPPEAVAGDDAGEAAWLDPWTVNGLAFDHDSILEKALVFLSLALEAGQAMRLLPHEFGGDEIRRLFEAVRIDPKRAAGWADAMTRARFLITVPGDPPRYRKRRP
jgi:8-oxo-dGTP diphosphatase